MKNQEMSFAAIKQAVGMEAVLRHYEVNPWSETPS